MKAPVLLALAAVTAVAVWVAGADEREVAEVAAALSPAEVVELTPPGPGAVADLVAGAGSRAGLDVADLHASVGGDVSVVTVTFTGGDVGDLAQVLGDLAHGVPLALVRSASAGPVSVTVALPVAEPGPGGTVTGMSSVGSP